MDEADTLDAGIPPGELATCTHSANEAKTEGQERRMPVFEVLEQQGMEVYLVNAQHTKNVPGRKKRRRGMSLRIVCIEIQSTRL